MEGFMKLLWKAYYLFKKAHTKDDLVLKADRLSGKKPVTVGYSMDLYEFTRFGDMRNTK
jgi:hypothetical protein